MSLEQDLRLILERAAPLHERLSGKFRALEATAEQDEKISRRLTAWQESAASGDAEEFERRLAWIGHDRRSIHAILGPMTLADGAEAPGWVASLRAFMEAAREKATTHLTAPYLDADNRMPFEEAFLPIVETAWRNLEERSPEGIERLSRTACGNLQRALLSQLTSMSSWALDLEYTLFRRRRSSSLWRLAAVLGDGTSRDQYLEFIRALLADGLRTFFLEYPVLGRLVATASDLWLATTAELLERLIADLPALQRTFADREETGTVESIRGRLSDRHNGGRSVQLLRFSSGLEVVYKPKRMDLEWAFSEFLRHLSGLGLNLDLRPLKVLDRGDYGWVEHVHHLPLAEPEMAGRYYTRAGMLLCLAYLMDATDCHHENVIAAGEYPQLVDAETLCHHRHRNLEPERQRNAAAVAQDRVWDSVLRTLFLPQWFLDRAGNSFDVSGFVGEGASLEVPNLRHMNTDHMHLVYETANSTPLPNQPYLEGGAVVPAAEHVNELAKGFREMFDSLRRHRETLLQPEGPLSLFAHRRVRFVARPTRVYNLLLIKSFHPDYLRNGIDRSILLDSLARPYLHAHERSPWWQTLEEDQQALELLDIPYYWALTDEQDLCQWSVTAPVRASQPTTMQERRFPGYFENASFPKVLRNFRSLAEEDRDYQEKLIRISFYAHQAAAPEGAKASVPENLENAGAGSPRISAGELQEEALRIAEDLAQSALSAPDGSVTWIGMQLIMAAERYQFQPIGESLFAGGAGVALFLAAVSRLSGERRYRDLALAAVQTSRQCIREEPELWARSSGLGGYSGALSVCYGLHAVATLVGEEELLTEAIQGALAVTPEQIGKDQAFDVIFGSAGALLVLLGLHRQRPADELLRRAIGCGDHLLAHRIPHPCGHRAWETVRGRALTGFSHGAAGIAFALLKLWQATAEDRFRDAAREALAFERAVYLPQRKNWPDLRFDPEEPGQWTCMTTWCHGAAGIALGRTAGLGLGDDPELLAEIDVALESTVRFALNPLDHLCCGNFGRASILHFAARRLQRPELMTTALGWAATTLDEARQAGGQYSLFWDIPRSVSNPGLMQGVAGIGLSLLGLAGHGGALPEVMLLDTKPSGRQS